MTKIMKMPRKPGGALGRLAGRSAAAISAVLALTFCGGNALAAGVPEELVPVGEAVGISIRTQGLVVSETTEFTENGQVSAPAREAGIVPGDVITAIDGVEVASAADMLELLGSAPEKVTVTYTRDGDRRTAVITPHMENGDAYLGVWVRDGLTGIGTVTWFDPETGEYGALGHSVSDSATGLTVPLREGELLSARVTGVNRSRAGEPGQITGALDREAKLGTIDKNCLVGIFGTARGLDIQEPVPVAKAGEVRTGPVKIISDASGQRREYDAKITRLYTGNDDGRDMMIKITDPDLIALTGGIVQGMSGSPILQDGKLVGAVTHVLINDPEKGYGVLAEHMLAAA